MNAFICICTQEYINYFKVLYKSLKTFHPDIPILLYYIGDSPPTEFDEVINYTRLFNSTIYPDILTRICSLRARAVLDAFNRGYDKVVFLGAKLEAYSDSREIFEVLNTHQAFTTPHILEPLPDDGCFPSNASVSFTGHISTDLVAFKRTPAIIKFLTWQDNIMKTQCATTQNTYLDQSWLNFLPFFVDDVYICKHLGFNVAYWNNTQRGLQKKNGKYIMKDGSSLVFFQFSGLDLDHPENISTHQNREKASGDYLEFLKDYARRVKIPE